MSEKVVGYVLLTLGVLMILYSLLSVVSVLTGKSKAYELFNFDAIGLDTSSLITNALPAGVDETQLGLPKETPKTELLPAEVLNDTTNIFIHIFLMGFVANAGLKLGILGSQMARPIYVNLKSTTVAPTPQKV